MLEIPIWIHIFLVSSLTAIIAYNAYTDPFEVLNLTSCAAVTSNSSSLNQYKTFLF